MFGFFYLCNWLKVRMLNLSTKKKGKMKNVSLFFIHLQQLEQTE